MVLKCSNNGDANLSPTDRFVYLALSFLCSDSSESKPCMTIAYLCKALRISDKTLTQSIKKLVRAKLVSKTKKQTGLGACSFLYSVKQAPDVGEWNSSAQRKIRRVLFSTLGLNVNPTLNQRTLLIALLEVEVEYGLVTSCHSSLILELSGLSSRSFLPNLDKLKKLGLIMQIPTPKSMHGRRKNSWAYSTNIIQVQYLVRIELEHSIWSGLNAVKALHKHSQLYMSAKQKKAPDYSMEQIKDFEELMLVLRLVPNELSNSEFEGSIAGFAKYLGGAGESKESHSKLTRLYLASYSLVAWLFKTYRHELSEGKYNENIRTQAIRKLFVFLSDENLQDDLSEALMNVLLVWAYSASTAILKAFETEHLTKFKDFDTVTFLNLSGRVELGLKPVERDVKPEKILSRLLDCA